MKKISICLENLHQLILIDNKIEIIIWSLIDHLSCLLNENFLNYKFILEIFLHLNIYQNQLEYKQILQLACSFTDIHMKIIEDKNENFFEELILWKDALINFIHFNNHDFHLFIIITLIDFIIPKLSVRTFESNSKFCFFIYSLLIKLMIQIIHVVQLICRIHF